MMTSCVRLFATTPTAPQGLSDAEEAQSPPPPMDPLIEQKRTVARAALEERCRGFKAIDKSAYWSLKKDFLDSGPEDSSDIRRMDAVTRSTTVAWSDEQANLITRSLYGGDPELSKSAFSAVLAGIDPNAPGGGDRMRAMMFALGPMFSRAPTTDYERLQACSSMGWCDGEGTAPNADFSPSRNVERLAESYKAAVAHHADARDLLAIH